MANNKGLIAKLANVPLAQPGFDALNMSAAVLVAMNPAGKWENCKPDNLDEERLRAVVQHLVNSKAITAVQSYCSQCALENQQYGDKSKYVPVIMMPIYAADQCPFDMECEVQKIEPKSKEPKKLKNMEEGKKTEKEKEKKVKRKGFVMQRLNDFDLLSQW